MNVPARAAVVAALVALAESAAFRDRVDAGKALARFVEDSRARPVLVAMLAEDADTMVTVEVAEELLRRRDAPGLAAVAAGLARADANHADWIHTAVADVFMVYGRERDEGLRVCSSLADDPDPDVARGAGWLAEALAEVKPLLLPE